MRIALLLLVLAACAWAQQTPVVSATFVHSPSSPALAAISPAPDFGLSVYVYAKLEADSELFRVRVIPVASTGSTEETIAQLHWVSGETGKWTFVGMIALSSGFQIESVQVSRLIEGPPAASTLAR